MREMKLGGTCAICGESKNDGAFWHTTATVLDFGIDGVPPLEPDMSELERCDACERLNEEMKIRKSLGDMRRMEELLRRRIAEGGEPCAE